MDDDKPENALPDEILGSPESNWEYTINRLMSIYNTLPDQKPGSSPLRTLEQGQASSDQDKKNEASENPEKLYQLFSPTSEGQDIINETLQAISGTRYSRESSQSILGNFCIEALNRIFNIAAQEDPWLRGNCPHSNWALPEILIKPSATTMKVDFTIESAFVPLPPLDLVCMMTDVDTWASMFSHIVYRGKGVELKTYQLSGTAADILHIQWVAAEFLEQIPFRATQKLTFIRFIKAITQDVWAVVDFDLEDLWCKSNNKCIRRPSRVTIGNSDENACRRRPSGVIIRKYDDSKSKVIWIENMEVSINSEWPFKAIYWINVLEHNFKRMSSEFLSSEPELKDKDLQNYLLAVFKDIAEAMTITYVDSIVTSGDEEEWTRYCPQENIKIWLKRKLNSQGPSGSNIFAAITRFHVEETSQSVFSYLREKNLKLEWCCARNMGNTEEKIRIASRDDDTNCITLHKDPFDDYLLQEASTVGFYSFVISSPITKSDFHNLCSKNWTAVALYPSGFTIMPVTSSLTSWVCISMQFHASPQEEAPKTMHNFLRNLIGEIEQEIKVNKMRITNPENSRSKVQLSDYVFQQEKRDCSFFLKTGKCKYNSKCKFNHPRREDKSQK